jgi:5-formyltetrahydrofolate cyclo-ligase
LSNSSTSYSTNSTYSHSVDHQLSALQKKRQLRLQMRNARKQLSKREQQQAALLLKHQLNQNPAFKYAKRIALYLANDGEVDTQLAIEQAWKEGKEIYLPVLDPIRKGHLWFLNYSPTSRMIKNRFGIAEPDPKFNKRVHAKFLNVVGLPLVAFDQQGNRLGMGGGFYDRTFEFCRSEGGIKPKLFGLAHTCQEAHNLPTENWDIQLNNIIVS